MDIADKTVSNMVRGNFLGSARFIEEETLMSMSYIRGKHAHTWILRKSSTPFTSPLVQRPLWQLIVCGHCSVYGLGHIQFIEKRMSNQWTIMREWQKQKDVSMFTLPEEFRSGATFAPQQHLTFALISCNRRIARL